MQMEGQLRVMREERKDLNGMILDKASSHVGLIASILMLFRWGCLPRGLTPPGTQQDGVAKG